MSQQPQPQPPSSPEPEGNQNQTQTSPSVLRRQSIKVLRGTIQVLEKLAVNLEAAPPSDKVSFLGKLQVGWSGAIAKIRSLLPENLSSKLSDTGLTSIVAGIAVIVIWTTSALLSEKPAEIANIPSPEQVPPAPTITTPLELTAPAAPEPIEVTPPPTPEPTPTPTVELTPEQNLIASIRNQVAETSDRFADGLIQSIQVNFESSRLIIKVGDDWYNLKQSQQDKLAARMLERSKELDFTHLEITDPQGTLIARSPVVGNDMVILKRQVVT